MYKNTPAWPHSCWKLLLEERSASQRTIDAAVSHPSINDAKYSQRLAVNQQNLDMLLIQNNNIEKYVQSSIEISLTFFSSRVSLYIKIAI
jgi:hypothetical protein